MKEYFQFLSFLLFYSLYYYTTSLAIPYVCPHDQSLVLLSLKRSFTIDELKSDYCESSNLKTETWNKSTDCCTWEGITCDKITGNVIELDLSCCQLSGSIDPDCSLFRLPHLQRLNLARNNIKASKISMIFGNFTHLAHLDLSHNDFSGEVPSEILKLTELTSLNLSSNAFTIRSDIFKLLLTNFTKLSQVDLRNMGILSSIPKNLSSSLEIVKLAGNNLHGELPQSIFHLPYLNTLELATYSELYGLLPNVNWNSRRTLEWLDLSGIKFSGNIPYSIGNLRALKHLDLSYCGISGVLPKRIFINMTQIETIRLTSNRLVGSLPSFPREMKHLIELSLCYNSFTGTIMPSWLLSLSSLEWLSLCSNQLFGVIPTKISSLVNLQSLLLGDNQLSGHILTELSSLVNLTQLTLNNNQLSGHVPTKFSSLVNLRFLDLSSNNFRRNLAD